MTSPAGPFGTRLRQWRLHRGLSQLGLAGQVGSTGRHISFLETGRSRPSRQTVLRLADALDVGRGDANDLLPAAYPTVPLDGADLAPYRAALDRMLAAHEPYPGMLLDGHWNVVAANDACAALFGVDRLRQHQRRHPFDPLLRELLAVAETALADVARPHTFPPEILVCPWFRLGDEIIRTIAMVARCDHPAEATLDDIHVELMYPMDDTAERFFRNRAAARNYPHDVENGDNGSDLTPTLHRGSAQRKEHQ